MELNGQIPRERRVKNEEESPKQDYDINDIEMQEIWIEETDNWL